MGDVSDLTPMCPRCQSLCPPDSRYCAECGVRLFNYPRFVVRELHGYPRPVCSSSSRVGTSYSIIDTWVNCQLVNSYASERFQRGRASMLAHKRAAELNAAYQREVAAPRNGKAV